MNYDQPIQNMFYDIQSYANRSAVHTELAKLINRRTFQDALIDILTNALRKISDPSQREIDELIRVVIDYAVLTIALDSANRFSDNDIYMATGMYYRDAERAMNELNQLLTPPGSGYEGRYDTRGHYTGRGQCQQRGRSYDSMGRPMDTDDRSRDNLPQAYRPPSSNTTNSANGLRQALGQVSQPPQVVARPIVTNDTPATPSPTPNAQVEAVMRYDQHRAAVEWFTPISSSDVSKKPANVSEFNTLFIDPIVKDLVTGDLLVSNTRSKREVSVYRHETPIIFNERLGLDLLNAVSAIGKSFNKDAAYRFSAVRPQSFSFNLKPAEIPVPTEPATHEGNQRLISELFGEVSEYLGREYVRQLTKRAVDLMHWFVADDIKFDSYVLDGNAVTSMLIDEGQLVTAKKWANLAERIAAQCLNYSVETKSDALVELTLQPPYECLLLPVHSGTAPLSVSDRTQPNRIDKTECKEFLSLITAAFDSDSLAINHVYFSNGDCLEVFCKDNDWYAVLVE